MSPKEIANRIKAKGLQKLRFFCQMCQKQCRDENGFKCHMMSESHARMMGVFADSPDKFMTDFSTKFERGYLDIVKRRYPTRRVHANVVYNEYIQDKLHVHMNSTIWPTLTDFVKYLGRTGKCKVEETERGWFIEYINRDPDFLRRQEIAEKRRAAEVDDEMRHDAELDAMVATAQALHGGKEDEDSGRYTELKRDGDVAKVKIALGPVTRLPAAAAGVAAPTPEHEEDPSGDGEAEEDELRHTAGLGPGPGDEGYEDYVKAQAQRAVAGIKRPRPQTIAAFAEEDDESPAPPPEPKRPPPPIQSTSRASGQETKQVPAPAEVPWLLPGMVVRILNKKLAGGKYYKQKAVVIEVVDEFVGVLKLLDGGDRLKMDQQELETVVPKTGGDVLILKGRHRGTVARLTELFIDRFCASLELTSGKFAGEKLTNVDYEDFSKVAETEP